MKRFNYLKRFSQLISAFALMAFTATASAQSTLIIRADSACALTVNGIAKGQIAADTAKPVPVSSGEQLIECKSANGAKAEQILSIESDTQKVVQLNLAAKVNAISSGIDKRFSDGGDGTVLDSKTDLQWAQRDNGSDINWNGARSYCSNLGTAGGSWRLPSMDELQGIYDDSGTLTTTCSQYTCRVSPLFKLSTTWFWSNESNGSSEAWVFYLRHGLRYSYPGRTEGSALCVRRRS